MTNEEMLLRALNGEELTATEFHPQTNKQAYLAYAVGLITDPASLPQPRTNEEVLLREYCLNGSFDGELPRLDNPGGPNQVLEGFEVIGPNGSVIVGVLPDRKGDIIPGDVDIDDGVVVIPPGVYDEETKVEIETEEIVVTPLDREQVIVPEGGKVIVKVIIKAVPEAGVILPDLEKPANSIHILKGYEAIDEYGAVIVGDMEDWSGEQVPVVADTSNGTISIPTGYYNDDSVVRVPTESKVVTPSNKEQTIKPSGGAFLGQVTVKPVPGGGGVTLPYLDNPASAGHIVSGFEAIDENGNVIVGEIEDRTGKTVNGEVDIEKRVVIIPEGFYGEETGVNIIVEERTVTPSGSIQEIVPAHGSVIGKVTVKAGTGTDLIINDVRSLFSGNRRLELIDQLLPLCKNFPSGEAMFYGSGALKEVDVSGLDVSEMTSAKQMFCNCSLLKTLDLSTWKTSRLQDMSEMFYYNTDLESIELSDLDTSNVTTMYRTFANCSKLASIDVSKWDTGNVTNFSNTFANCPALESVDVSNWDTHEATTMASMFSGCGIKSIDMTNWDTRKVTTMQYIFQSCNKLRDIVGFSATNKAGVSIGFPYENSNTNPNYPLKRLTFKTEGLDGLHAIRSAIFIKNCSFTRGGMVEMFNTLTDVSDMTHAVAQKTITITGNPCVTGSIRVAGAGSSGIAISSYADFVAECDAFYGDLDRTGATVSLYKTGSGWLTYDPANVTEEDFNFTLVRFNAYTANVPESDVLTDEDRAIATAKGWTLVE